jgi:hypothetical protein
VATDGGENTIMSAEISSQLPTEILEQRAAEQRQRIHNSVGELKSTLRETVREHLDVENYARSYIWRFVAVASVIALISGYGVAGMFSRR